MARFRFMMLFIKKLLNSGADVEAKDKDGKTPRDLAKDEGIIRLLDQATKTETP